MKFRPPYEPQWDGKGKLYAALESKMSRACGVPYHTNNPFYAGTGRFGANTILSLERIVEDEAVARGMWRTLEVFRSTRG